MYHQLMEKLNAILVQFGREVDQVKMLFNAQCARPPLASHQSPTAGAIQWSRDLFARVKRTMLKFKEMGGWS